MSDIVLEMVFIAVLLLLNGFFAMSEMAVVSARKTRLQQLGDQGNQPARRALALTEEPDQFLSTVQIGITLVGILAGAFGGATFTAVLAEQLEQVAWLAQYSDAISLGIVVLAITYFSLVVGELVPKRLALQSPERIAMLAVAPMRILTLLTFPLVRVLSASTDLVIRLLGIRPTEDDPITEDEITLLVAQGARAGVLEKDEQEMISSVFHLNDWHVSAIMTPYTDIDWLDTTDPVDEIWQRVSRSGHSGFPVCQGQLDNVLGVVRTNELLDNHRTGKPLELPKLVRKPHFIPESATVSQVIALFKATGEHIILVVSEHGSIQGLLTLHDILETIVGDTQNGEPQVVQREDGSWLVDGLLAIDEFKKLLGVDALPEEERGTYQTLGGFVMQQTDQVPVTGQHFTWGKFRFEVVDMDGHRVDQVLVMLQSDAEADAKNAPTD